jgi:hypothetical protein
VEPPKRGCPTDRYRYPTQELGVRLDDELKMQDGQKLGGVVAIDREAKTIDIKKTKKTAEVHPQVLYANKLVSPVALARLAAGAGRAHHRARRRRALHVRARHRDRARAAARTPSDGGAGPPRR